MIKHAIHSRKTDIMANDHCVPFIKCSDRFSIIEKQILVV